MESYFRGTELDTFKQRNFHNVSKALYALKPELHRKLSSFSRSGGFSLKKDNYYKERREIVWKSTGTSLVQILSVIDNGEVEDKISTRKEK